MCCLAPCKGKFYSFITNEKTRRPPVIYGFVFDNSVIHVIKLLPSYSNIYRFLFFIAILIIYLKTDDQSWYKYDKYLRMEDVS
jgi:hypothetical protein